MYVHELNMHSTSYTPYIVLLYYNIIVVFMYTVTCTVMYISCNVLHDLMHSLLKYIYMLHFNYHNVHVHIHIHIYLYEDYTTCTVNLYTSNERVVVQSPSVSSRLQAAADLDLE